MGSNEAQSRDMKFNAAETLTGTAIRVANIIGAKKLRHSPNSKTASPRWRGRFV